MRHIRDVVEIEKDVIQLGLAGGNAENTGYGAFQELTHRINAGENLEMILNDCDGNLRILETFTPYLAQITTMTSKQVILNFQGKTTSYDSFTSDEFSEE